MLPNPYRPPDSSAKRTNQYGSIFVQSAAGLLSVSGIALLPSVFLVFTIPGVFIWVNWILIAFDKSNFKGLLFWTLSALWNLSWLIFLIDANNWFQDTPSTILGWHMLVHSAVACALSIMCALLSSLEQNRRDR